MSRARILVTGAGGFTGQHLLPALRAAGHEVIGFARNADPEHGIVAAGFDDPAALRVAVATVAPTHVIHLAAISYVAHGDVEAMYRVNALGSLHLLQALAALPRSPQRVILASTCNVYSRAEGLVPETATIAPVNHYGASKVAMEAMVGAFATQLSLVVTRPFNYTGPGQASRFLVPKLVDAFAQRLPEIELGNLDVERDFLDVRDVAERYIRLLDADLPATPAVVNLCAGEGLWLREVVELLREITGHVPALRVNPAFVRADEIRRLVGDPARQDAWLGRSTRRPFRKTLEDMLAAHRA